MLSYGTRALTRRRCGRPAPHRRRRAMPISGRPERSLLARVAVHPRKINEQTVSGGRQQIPSIPLSASRYVQFTAGRSRPYFCTGAFSVPRRSGNRPPSTTPHLRQPSPLSGLRPVIGSMWLRSHVAETSEDNRPRVPGDRRVRRRRVPVTEWVHLPAHFTVASAARVCSSVERPFRRHRFQNVVVGSATRSALRARTISTLLRKTRRTDTAKCRKGRSFSCRLYTRLIYKCTSVKSTRGFIIIRTNVARRPYWLWDTVHRTSILW